MPLNVRRLSSSIFLVLFISVSCALAQVQQAVNQPTPVPSVPVPIKTATAGDIMRDRISKAKAFIAVRNYNAAIYELEMIRRETSDTSVQAVTNILLMNSYLEQGNYKKAQDFLEQFHKQFKANNPSGSMNYSAVAAQVVKGARNQIERYRSLGLSVSDRNLPLEAVNDIEKMREMLEILITQTKETQNNKACADVAMPLLEEATAARSSLARDEYDAKRWRDEGNDAREQVVSSRSVVINATDGTAVPQKLEPPQTNPAFTLNPPQTTQTNFASNTAKPIQQSQQTQQTKQVSQPVTTAVNKPSDTQVASNTAADLPVTKKQGDTPANVSSQTVQTANTPKSNETPKETRSAGPVEVGSLLEFATTKAPPLYPAAARSMRASGVVKVEVVVNEKGEVAEVKKAEGHALLQGAAKDAIRKWKFRPVTRDGQAVSARGFINFNFTL